jgi:hypothetical protein
MYELRTDVHFLRGFWDSSVFRYCNTKKEAIDPDYSYIVTQRRERSTQITTTITGRQLTPTKYLNTEESRKPCRKCTSVRSPYMRGKICYKTEFEDGSVSFSDSLCYCRWFVEDLVVTVLMVSLCCFIYQGVTIFSLCLSVYFSVTNGFIPFHLVRSPYMRGKICYKTEFEDGSVSFSEAFDPDDPSLIDRHP